MMNLLVKLSKRVWALLPFGAAGDERRPGPLYHLDPGTRRVHRTECVWRNKTEYTYSSLAEAIGAGGDPCRSCLHDWEEILGREGHADAVSDYAAEASLPSAATTPTKAQEEEEG